MVSQYGRLLITLVKLKGWRFLFAAVTIVALTSNHFLYEPISALMLRLGKKDLHYIGAYEFAMDNIVLGDVDRYATQLAIVGDFVEKTGSVQFNKSIVKCNSERDCKDKFFDMLLGNSVPNKMVHYVDYESIADARTKLKCQMQTGYELYCPYMAYLTAISQAKINSSLYFNNTNVFRLLSTFDPLQTSEDESPHDICTNDVNFSQAFPYTLLGQMILVKLSLLFYLLVSTVSCIYELKENGFLQLMFRRRLSVMAYWFALWTITVFEMIIFASILALSHYFQCSAFYNRNKITSVFELALLHFCTIASLVFLATVLTRRSEVVAFISCLLCLAATGVAITVRAILNKTKEHDNLRTYMLAVPFGHLAEHMLAVLLRDRIKPITYLNLLPLVSVGLLGVAFIAAVYLDFVLKSGSGLRLPFLYIFYCRFWSKRKNNSMAQVNPECSFMIERMSARMVPMICVSELEKSYSACCCSSKKITALKEFSGFFYQDQITSIVGHNGSGKSTMLQLLSGDRHATKGYATIENLVLTDSLDRYHFGNQMGYCPQSDILVDRLTVLDTLRLTASSAGLAWDDVRFYVIDLLVVFEMKNKKNCCIGSLTSSQKRKLCVTMALIGKPKLIMLDNPSRDMDYISKRRMWKILHDHKMGRAIICTSLFMDEAEGMADRMIVLSDGQLFCVGSSFFSKCLFDCRFIIQIASKTEFHVPQIIRKVTSKFQCVRLRSVACADLEFEVPLTQDAILPDVILAVEELSDCIAEFGICNFSLDDVFGKLKGLSVEEIVEHVKRSTIGYVADDTDRICALKNRRDPDLPMGPNEIKVSHFLPRTVMSMINVKFQLIRRSKARCFSRLFVPLLLLLLVVGATLLEKFAENSKVDIRYDLTNLSSFESNKGICMFYYYLKGSPNALDTSIINEVGIGNHLDMVQKEDCTIYLSGQNYSSASRVYSHLMAPPVPPFRQRDPLFVQAMKTDISTIRQKCGQIVKPCPIVYSNDWCNNRSVGLTNYKMYVGSYVDDKNYTAESVAINAIEVIKNTLSHLTYQFGLLKRSRHLTPRFEVEGVLGTSAVCYKLYGTYVQLAVLTLVPSFCLFDVLQEKKKGIRRQLLSMGMSKFYYWTCLLTVHWIKLATIYLLSILPLILIIWTGYSSVFYFAAVLPPTLTLGLINSLLCTYVLSMFFERATFVVISVYAFFCLMVTMSSQLVQTSNSIGQVMIFLFPQYAAIAPTFYGVKLIYYTSAYYSENVEPSILRVIGTPGRFRDSLMALAAHFVLFIIALVVLENWSKICRSCKCRRKYKAEPDIYQNCKESRILEEISQVTEVTESPENGSNSVNIMKAVNLKAVRSDGQVLVKNLTFGLKHGEIFGLLGPCGSGKGAAVRAIVDYELQSAGTVKFYVDDRWLPSGSAAQRGFIGYCPKNDPLIERLTVLENLFFYSRAIGVRTERVKMVLKHFHLEKDKSTVVMLAAAGVKRRLTLAIAILISPRFLAIDQASTGVDPEGRQVLWQTIKSLAGMRRGILVATQQMEEAENLCGRICIMNGGVMAALNSVKDLVDRYRQLYMLELQISEDIDRSKWKSLRTKKQFIIDAILERFFGATVIEQLTSRIQIAVPIKSMGSLSGALRWVLERKSSFDILYFTLHYASIDQTIKTIIVQHNNEIMKDQSEYIDSSVSETASFVL